MLISSKKYSTADISVTTSEIKEKTVGMYSLLGLLQQTPESFIEQMKAKHLRELGITQPEIESMILQRNKAKQEKDYANADKIRNELLERGIILNDGKAGTGWDIKDLYNIA